MMEFNTVGTMGDRSTQFRQCQDNIMNQIS